MCLLVVVGRLQPVYICKNRVRALSRREIVSTNAIYRIIHILNLKPMHAEDYASSERMQILFPIESSYESTCIEGGKRMFGILRIQIFMFMWPRTMATKHNAM